MNGARRGLIVLSAAALALVTLLCPFAPGRAADTNPPTPSPPAALPAETAVAALIEANGGKVPATGEQFWKAVTKLGKFSQLPVPFSAARLGSGLLTPRVVIAPETAAAGHADATAVNLQGRLFLAANMFRPAAGGDPRVISVEFISWNTARRQFDFGVIDSMGGQDPPRLVMLDGGRCFVCHKNRGPILGARPWSNSTQDDILRFSVAASLQMTGSALPDKGPFALPRTSANGSVLRDRVDGMALALPEAPDVDTAVRLGAYLRTGRDVFRLMTRTADGRKGLVVLLVALTEPGVLEANYKPVQHALDAAFNQTFEQFAADWVALQKGMKPSALIDVDPSTLVIASGVRPVPRGNVSVAPVTNTVLVPGLVGGSGSRWSSPGSPRVVGTPTKQVDPVATTLAIQAAKEKKAIDDYTATLTELSRYDAARAAGSPGLLSRFQPSNPRAFLRPNVTRPRHPSDVLNPLLLAETIGLTDGDRRFLTHSLADAAMRVGKPKVTAAVLAKEIFEGPAFADVLAGGPLPDRDEFKDRFVAGLDAALTTAHGLATGFAPERREYASGPRYDPNAAEEREVAVVPTTACLRCHEVGGPAKAPRFDPIPPLAFDPFDKAAREAWVRAADAKHKKEVLSRLLGRLVTDADMPPEDAPEHDRFRVKDPAGFDEVKRFLTAELGK